MSWSSLKIVRSPMSIMFGAATVEGRWWAASSWFLETRGTINNKGERERERERERNKNILNVHHIFQCNLTKHKKHIHQLISKVITRSTILSLSSHCELHNNFFTPKLHNTYSSDSKEATESKLIRGASASANTSFQFCFSPQMHHVSARNYCWFNTFFFLHNYNICQPCFGRWKNTMRCRS